MSPLCRSLAADYVLLTLLSAEPEPGLTDLPRLLTSLRLDLDLLTPGALQAALTTLSDCGFVVLQGEGRKARARVTWRGQGYALTVRERLGEQLVPYEQKLAQVARPACSHR